MPSETITHAVLDRRTRYLKAQHTLVLNRTTTLIFNRTTRYLKAQHTLVFNRSTTLVFNRTTTLVLNRSTTLVFNRSTRYVNHSTLVLSRAASFVAVVASVVILPTRFAVVLPYQACYHV